MLPVSLFVKIPRFQVFKKQQNNVIQMVRRFLQIRICVKVKFCIQTYNATHISCLNYDIYPSIKRTLLTAKSLFSHAYGSYPSRTQKLHLSQYEKYQNILISLQVGLLNLVKCKHLTTIKHKEKERKYIFDTQLLLPDYCQSFQLAYFTQY